MACGDALSRFAGTGCERLQTRGNLTDPAAYKILQFFPLPTINFGASDYNLSRF